MERLTKRTKDGQAVMDCDACENAGNDCHLYQCRNRLKDRLAAYEDTGLTPEVILELLADATAMDKQLKERQHAAPVRRGHWEEFDHYICNSDDKPVAKIGVIFVCSECGREKKVKEHYCPSCGANMDPNAEEETP